MSLFPTVWNWFCCLTKVKQSLYINSALLSFGLFVIMETYLLKMCLAHLLSTALRGSSRSIIGSSPDIYGELHSKFMYRIMALTNYITNRSLLKMTLMN